MLEREMMALLERRFPGCHIQRGRNLLELSVHRKASEKLGDAPWKETVLVAAIWRSTLGGWKVAGGGIVPIVRGSTLEEALDLWEVAEVMGR